MKVKAKTKLHYGDKLRQVGEVFVLKPRKVKEWDKVKKMRTDKALDITAEEQFNEEIMERVSEGTAVRRPPKEKNRPSNDFTHEYSNEARAAHEPRPEEEETPTGDQDVI
jgi:hypothetical protein